MTHQVSDPTSVRFAGGPDDSWRRSLGATDLRSTSREAGEQLVATVANEVASAERSPVDLLEFVATAIAGLEGLTVELVAEARQQYGKRSRHDGARWSRSYRGRYRWEDIGRALGMTGEGARKKYGELCR